MDALTTPSNWQKVRLGDILSYEQPTKFLVATTQYLQKGFTPILTAGKTFILGYTNDKHGIYTNIPVIIFDDFTTDSKMVNFPFKVKSSAIKILSLRDNNQADLKYIYEKLTLLKHQVTDHKRYWIDEFSNIEILLPPLNEQIAIANILSGLDHYLCSLDALILKKEGVKKALSFELLSQRKRLKGFNQAWQKVRLGDILSYEQPTKFLVATTQYLQKGFTPILTAGKTFILGYTNDKHGIYTNIPVIIFDDFTTDSKMVNFPFKVKSSAIKILSLRDNNQADLKYIYEKLTLLKHQVTDHKRYWIDEFSNIEILLPPLNEQIAIANILSGLDSEIISLKNKKRQFENIKKALNHDLMSAKIRVLNK
ncbi:restriction endonuclease subunit S [Helicobacter pylori]|uniref:restriction endonuclease subunit S n=1 Tax=Helicobacter pylori TaxID=210 RepID=UPI001AE8E3E3|nr:restriction endonuclease subunit S [Helicobacter pylori]QTO94752.1 restriction endonuclease subunit S [Helicobacter pylori]WQU41327.1 restriction endonuclease subunit S [Helicobacter pylori]